MTVFVVLFRGVGGATQLPTAALRAALAEAGFEKVATYINSGNAVVRTALSPYETVAAIERICADRFGFDKAIYAVPFDEWARLIARNPFAVAESGGKFLHAAWLGAAPTPEAIAALKALAINGDGFEVVDRVAYINTPGGFSNSKIAERFDKRIGVPNTARNWNTVLKLRALAEQAAN
ncbi:DUF1697 domain-containing protein [Methylopila sp. M107]|uniref:DUF1697 domain-containing protein n=1 Tax=Methylopila sp. M107 TaxID=1101190 RepID=UPI00037D194E|nr:DUF1697 domain-containing protein [Methylopila sp. M107]